MSGPLVLGIDFGGTKVALAVTGLDGRPVIEQTISTRPDLGAHWNLDRAMSAAAALVAEASPVGELVAVGACTFGIPLDDRVQLAVAIPGWDDVALASEIATALECDRVVVATDVKAAAAVEAQAGALIGADPAIYLNLGTGLAIGIVIGGTVVAGANGAAGEIGYSLRTFADIGRQPRDRVLLEQIVSGMGLRDVASRTSGADLSAADVFAGARDNEMFGRTLDRFLEELSFHLVNLCVALDPARVAVGGGMVRSWDLIEPTLSRALSSSVPFPPDLVLGAFPYDAPLVGAIAMGVEAATGRLDAAAHTSDARAPADRGP